MTTKKLRKTAVLFLIATLFFGFGKSAAYAQFDHSHHQFNSVLSNYLRDGFVNYAALKNNPDNLENYLSALAKVTESEFDGWTPQEQLAYLINLYNAQTLDLIIDNYPLGSIKEIQTLFRGPWDQTVVHLFGQVTTLNQLEHEIIRKNYSEPRIHFALVCAAKSCPPLRSEAYTAQRLDAQLQDQGIQFFRQKGKNRFDANENILYLSPIFKWFKADFLKQVKNLRDYVVPFVEGDIPERDYRIKYTDYDWGLNDAS